MRVPRFIARDSIQGCWKYCMKHKDITGSDFGTLLYTLATAGKAVTLSAVIAWGLKWSAEARPP
jgi:hypothetical protein